MKLKTVCLMLGFFGLIFCALTIALRKTTVFYCSFQSPNQLQIWTRYSAKNLQLDLTTAVVRPSQSKLYEYVWYFPNAMVRVSHGAPMMTSESKWEDCEATLIDNDGLETKFIFQWPRSISPQFLDSTTVVCAENKKLHVLDIRSPSKIGTFPLANDQMAITPIPNSKRIVVTPNYAPLATDQNWMLDVSDLDQINLIAKWPSGIGITVGKDCLYEATLDRSTVVRRSLFDGSELGKLNLSPEIQSVFNPMNGDTIEVIGTLIVIGRSGGQTYFDLETQRRIELGRSDLLPVRNVDPPLPIRLFYAEESSPNHIVAYDPVSQRVVWELHSTSEFMIFETQPPENIILGTDEFGLSVDVIDARTGKSLRSFTPFRYLSWLMAFTEVGFAAWIVTWLCSSDSQRVPVWINVSLLSVVALGLFCSLHLGSNWWPEDRSVPQSYCQGIFLGLSTSGLAWLAFGRARIGIRYLPMMLIVLLLMLFARYVIPTNPYFKSSMVSIVLLHVAAASVAFGGLRLLGLRFELAEHSSSKHESLRLLDLFVLLGVVALAITMARPIFSLDVPRIDIASTMGLIPFAAGAGCMLAVLFRNRILFTAVCILAAMIYSSMIFESLFQFVTSRPIFVDRNHFVWHWFRISAAGLVTNFLVYMAYRNASQRFILAGVA